MKKSKYQLIISKVLILLCLLNISYHSYGQNNTTLQLIYGNVLFGYNLKNTNNNLKIKLPKFECTIEIQVDSLKRIQKYKSKYLSFNIYYYQDSIVKEIYIFDRRYFNIKSDNQYIKEIYQLYKGSIILMKQYDLYSMELLAVFRYRNYCIGKYTLIEYSDEFDEKWTNLFLLNEKSEIISWYKEFNYSLKEVYRKININYIYINIFNKRYYIKELNGNLIYYNNTNKIVGSLVSNEPKY